MYNVKLYNKISKVGLDDLDAAKYTCLLHCDEKQYCPLL